METVDKPKRSSKQHFGCGLAVERSFAEKTMPMLAHMRKMFILGLRLNIMNT